MANGDTPNLPGLITDPDFQGLSPAGKRAALSRITGDETFNSLNDGETMQFLSKFQAPPPQPNITTGAGMEAQSQQQAGQYLQQRATAPYEQQQAELQQRKNRAVRWQQNNPAAVTNASMLFAPASAAKSLIGAKVGSKVGGTVGKQISPQGEQYGQVVGGLIGGGAPLVEEGLRPLVQKQISKFYGETPERINDLKALPQAEEQIRQRVVQAEAQSRATFKAAYPKIDAAPVNVANVKNLAKAAEDGIVSGRAPAPLRAVSNIPEPSPSVLGTNTAGEMEPDLNEVLRQLKAADNIPFRQAQLYRSAIEQYISRAKGKLPGDIYSGLKNVSNALGSGLSATAEREGVGIQYGQADALFKQHAADFWNPNAPLKSIVQGAPQATGATMNRFMQTASRARVMDALERRGVPTDDIKGILARGDKTVRKDFSDAAKLKQLGPDIFNQQVAGQNRQLFKGAAVKTGAGLAGLGGLYEFLRQATRQKGQSP